MKDKILTFDSTRQVNVTYQIQHGFSREIEKVVNLTLRKLDWQARDF